MTEGSETETGGSKLPPSQQILKILKNREIVWPSQFYWKTVTGEQMDSLPVSFPGEVWTQDHVMCGKATVLTSEPPCRPGNEMTVQNTAAAYQEWKDCPCLWMLWGDYVSHCATLSTADQWTWRYMPLWSLEQSWNSTHFGSFERLEPRLHFARLVIWTRPPCPVSATATRCVAIENIQELWHWMWRTAGLENPAASASRAVEGTEALPLQLWVAWGTNATWRRAAIADSWPCLILSAILGQCMERKEQARFPTPCSKKPFNIWSPEGVRIRINLILHIILAKRQRNDKISWPSWG